MAARALAESIRNGALAHGFSLGAFKLRVYGSWLHEIAVHSVQPSRGLVSVASTPEGLKELVIPGSIQTAKRFFSSSAAQSIEHLARVHGSSSASSSVLSSLCGRSAIRSVPQIGRQQHLLKQQATFAQKAFSQQATQGRAAFCAKEFRVVVGKAFSQQSSSRFFSGATRVFKEAGGEASGGTAAKANGATYPGKRFIEWYLQKIEEKPLLVKSLTAGVIFVASDLCAQALGGGRHFFMDAS